MLTAPRYYHPRLRLRGLERLGLTAVAFSAVALATMIAPISSATADSLSARVIDSDAETVANAVLYLTDMDDNPLPGLTATVVARVDQVGKTFIPEVTVITQGSALEFANSDPISHHVYSFSKAKRLNVVVPAGGDSDAFVFDKPGPVALGCNIHDSMSAFIFVSPSPRFAKTSSDGMARFADLAAGRYKLWYWHPRGPRQKIQHMVVAVSGDSTATVNFALRPAPRGRRRGGRRY